MGVDYEILFAALQQHNYSLQAFLSLFLLSISRLLPIIALTPYFGARVLPHPVKFGFAVALWTIILPKLFVVVKEPLYFSPHLLLLLEFFIGLTLGIMATVPFWIVETAGMFTDHQRGGASLNNQDPVLGSQSSPLGTFYNLFLIYMFYLFNGPFLFIEAIYTSYEVLPPDQLLSRVFFYQDVPFWNTVLSIFSVVLRLGIQIASPALLAILMTDMFLGIINRMAPQVMITFLGLPLKSLLGLTLVCLGWKLLGQQMVKEALLWTMEITKAIQSLPVGS